MLASVSIFKQNLNKAIDENACLHAEFQTNNLKLGQTNIRAILIPWRDHNFWKHFSDTESHSYAL